MARSRNIWLDNHLVNLWSDLNSSSLAIFSSFSRMSTRPSHLVQIFFFGHRWFLPISSATRQLPRLSSFALLKVISGRVADCLKLSRGLRRWSLLCNPFVLVRRCGKCSSLCEALDGEWGARNEREEKSNLTHIHSFVRQLVSQFGFLRLFFLSDWNINVDQHELIGGFNIFFVINPSHGEKAPTRTIWLHKRDLRLIRLPDTHFSLRKALYAFN